MIYRIVNTTKSTTIAYTNTALIKYWGKQDEEQIIPMNNSISITNDTLKTTTTVEFSNEYKSDSFILNGEESKGKIKQKVVTHLSYIREISSNSKYAKVVSENNFPTSAGLASSASGFAALTMAACSALDLKKSTKELSIISRRGSGSSCRSFYGGYVEWLKEDDNGDSYAIQLADEKWFDISNLVIVVNAHKRKINTRDAMKQSMKTSPFYKSRINNINHQLENIRKAIKEKDFTLLGKTAEMDCLNMHYIAMTSNPSLIFWTPDTLKIMKAVIELREQDIEAYYTIDTGANIHILTQPEFESEVLKRIKELNNIEQIINSKIGPGAHEITEHLF
ncbi:MAG: diphosphomevalonate decarboxylase [Asgard group archaeon]|nr:diphosphomevalonate decarboxylase [Asgard group archaeon]